ncbi:DUF3025 domain-containing protein [Ralstonia syzygii]|uniref:DUF3025 domain-containing protein n=1 Tax=Ralstonia syzygii TaxID=28097 RepID=A0ABX7ZHI0_9RALS|nr:DUF3025 domain-containing protein [Ralstonia syzygii]QUP54928.1 DUF3025 domain-containing protein [Ralstonia syzygii]
MATARRGALRRADAGAAARRRDAALEDGLSRVPAGLIEIDWAHPAFARLAAVGAPVAQAVGQGADLRDVLNAHAERQDLRTAGGHPLRFIPQGALPSGAAYEAHIAATGGVPTRDNLHDFFNALIWLYWPRTKAALNARQASAIARDGIGAVRGAVRDAATLFDENALIFLRTDDAPERCLTGFDWPGLFIEGRAAWGRSCAVLPFGHALLEKLVAPYKSITAHAWPVHVASLEAAAQTASIDAVLADTLASADLTTSDFRPLPVMGIPGWCEANRDPAFYSDTAVFRAGRRTSAKPGQKC